MIMTLRIKTYKKWLADMVAEQYEQMLLEIGVHCWCCGRQPNDRPAGWFAPWLIERAHIVNKPRSLDRRAVILACSMCHKGGMHGQRLVLNGLRVDMPRLRLDHLMWIKKHRDPGFYDRAFLQSKTVRVLPQRLQRPPVYYLDQYASRRYKFLAAARTTG
jgi:hypothetical protein